MTTAKPSESKRLYWSMVLATIVLVACFSTSPKAMDSKTIVAGSSASQYALGVEQSDVRVKRHLRSNVHTRDFFGIAQDNELINAFDKMVDKPIIPKHMLMNVKFQEWAKLVENAYPDHLKAEEAKLAVLLLHFHPATVRRMINTGKSAPATKVAARNLELAYMLKLMADGRQDDVLRLQRYKKSRMAMLASPVWTDWIEKGTAKSKKTLYKLLFNYFEDLGVEGRLRLFIDTKRNPATFGLARELENLQLKAWLHENLDGGIVFDLLKLAEAGNRMVVHPLFKTWFSYMKKLEKRKHPSLRRETAFDVLREKVGVQGLADAIKIGKSVESSKEIAGLLEVNLLKLNTDSTH